MDVVLEVHALSHDQKQGLHHREAGEHRTRHEVGWKDGGVPSGDHRGCEVHRDDGVHREHEGGGDPCQNEADLLKTVPVLGTSGPSERQHAVNLLLNGAGHTVADGGEVGNQSDVPKHQRNREVGRDGEHVPQKRTVEVHPQRPKLVGEWEHPVAHPNASHVDAREHRRHDDRENGHGLCRAVDGHTPLLTEQQQHRRNQGSCVADADPPHEVGDVPCPVHGLVQAPSADACAQEIQDATHAVDGDEAGNGDHDFPTQRSWSHDGPHHVVRDVLVGLVPQNQGFANGCFSLHVEGIRLRWTQCCAPSSCRRCWAGCPPPPRRGTNGCCWRWCAPSTLRR